MTNLAALALALPLVTAAEGCVLKAYSDKLARPPIWTIGHGTTHIRGAPVHEGMVCSKAQADTWAEADMAAMEAAIMRLCKVTLSDHQIAVCISLSYNIGLGNFSRSNVLEAINAGLLTVAADRILQYCFAGGVRVPGLLLRRQRERAMFLTGVAPAAPKPPLPPFPKDEADRRSDIADEADRLNDIELDRLNPKPA